MQETNSPLAESNEACDFGWLPANGVISGRVGTPDGAGTQDVEIQLTPSPNSGLLLDGEGGHVRIANNETFNFGENDSFTLEVWVRYSGTAGTGIGNGFILDTRSDNSNYPFTLFAARNTNLPGRIEFLREGSTRITLSSVRTDLNDNEWHHIAAVHDADANLLQLFIDGELDNSISQGSIGSTTNNADLYFGRRGGNNFDQWFSKNHYLAGYTSCCEREWKFLL